MEELLGFVGFSLGASLGVGLTRSLGEGTRPLLRTVVKAAIRAWDATANASAAVRAESAPAGEGTSVEPAGRARRRRAEPQKIAIARS
jgi:hypothetical protein